MRTQRTIADYLDAETARIDALIAKRRRMIDLLRNRFDALADHLLAHAMPESRSIYLGQVLDRLIDYRGATPAKSMGGVPLLTATNIVDGRINMDASRQFVSEHLYVDWMSRGFPVIGDLLLTTEAPLGELALIEDTYVALAQRLMVLRVRPDLMLPGFLLFYLRSSVGHADLLSRASGSTVMGIRTDRLRQVRVQVPPLPVQHEIVNVLMGASTSADEGSLLLRQQGDLLRERRQALITAAVTGQLEVPGVAA